MLSPSWLVFPSRSVQTIRAETLHQGGAGSEAPRGSSPSRPPARKVAPPPRRQFAGLSRVPAGEENEAAAEEDVDEESAPAAEPASSPAAVVAEMEGEEEDDLGGSYYAINPSTGELEALRFGGWFVVVIETCLRWVWFTCQGFHVGLYLFLSSGMQRMSYWSLRVPHGRAAAPSK
mgnify:CR=1 FL=1